MTSPQGTTAPTCAPPQFGSMADRILSTLLSNLPGVTYRCQADPDGTVEFVSEGFSSLTGHPVAHILGQPRSHYVDLIHPDDRATAVEQLQRALAERRQYHMEYRLRTATGEEKWVWEHGMGVFSETGPLEALEGLVLDITARKQAELALQQSEERYRSLAESTRDVVTILDREGSLLYANRMAASCVGLAPADLVGKTQQDLFPPALAETHLQRIRQVMADGQPCEEDELHHFGDGEVWLNVHLTPLQDGAGRVASVIAVSRDITERKRTEAALREAQELLDQKVRERTAELTRVNERLVREMAERQLSDEKYRTLVETSPDAVLLVDLEGRVSFASPRAVEMHGSERAEEILGRNPLEFVVPEDHTKLLANLRRTAEEGITRNIEYTLLRKDGTCFSGEASAAAVRDLSGQPTALAVIVRDITERKRTEEALRESEDRLTFALETGRTGAWDLDLVDLTAHRSLLHDRIFGYEALLPTWTYEMFLEHVLPEDRDEVDRRFQQAVESGGDWSFECRIRRVDGACRWIWAAGRHRRDASGHANRMAGIVQDITERKQAEDVLRQMNQQFHTICEGMIEGLLITDIATKRFVRVNASLCRMLGFSEQELLAASIRDIHPPEEVPNDLERFQAAAEGRVSINENRPVLRKDGSIFYADITGHRILYDGRPCLLALFRDVTERRQAQELLRRQNEMLRRSLLSSDHERRIISYEIHDSIAQQLAGATLQFEACEQFRAKRKSKAAAEAFQEGTQILRACQLEARRLIRGVRPLALDQSSVVVAIGQFVQGFEGKPGPRVEFHSQVEFDRLQPKEENAIYRIVQEAVTNARRHSHSETVRVELRQQGDKLLILVQDWGVGFETTDVDHCTFGLESIRERAQMLGGRAEIETTPGQGTRITVELPVLLREDD
jgi:PAS domain S-box-containing protein